MSNYIEVIINLKNGKKESIDPFLSITCDEEIISIFNGEYNYDFKIKDIKNLQLNIKSDNYGIVHRLTN